MSLRIIDWKSGVATTAGAATSTICDSDVIPTNATVTVSVYLQGRETTTGAMASTSFEARGARVAGSLALVGSAIALVTMAAGSDAALATAAASVVLNGNALRLQVVGVAATNVEWFGDMRVRVN